MHFQLAMNLVNHGSFFYGPLEHPNFTDYSGIAVSFYLAPFLLWKGIYPGIYLAKIGLLIVSASSSVLVYTFSRQLFQNSWAALAAGLAFAVCPLSIGEATFIMNDTLALFLFLATMNLLVWVLRSQRSCYKQVFFLGLLAGLTALARYAYFPIFPVVFLALLFQPKRFTFSQKACRLLLLALAIFLTFGGWMIRYWLIQSGPDPSKFVKSMTNYSGSFLTDDLPKENKGGELAARYRNFYFTRSDWKWLREKLGEAEDPHRAVLFLCAVAGLAAWALRYRRTPGVFPLLFFMLIYPLILITRHHLHARYRLPLIASYSILSSGAIALLLEPLRFPLRLFQKIEPAASVFLSLLIVGFAVGETKQIFVNYRQSSEKLQWVATVADKNAVILTPHARNPWRIFARTGLPVVADFPHTAFLVDQIPLGTQNVRELWNQKSVEDYLEQEVFNQNKRAYVLGEDYKEFHRNLIAEGAPYAPLLKNSNYELKEAHKASHHPKFQLFELIPVKK